MESSIQVGVSGPAVWVRVEGKGSFLNSGNFKQFAREMVVMMDSTFMGTMAGLALRLKELGQGHLRVVHCGERSRQLLSGLGLDQLFQISSNGARAPECGALATKTLEKKEQAKEMLAAHEALCEAAPENLLRFKDVLDYLKQDLHDNPVKK